MTTLIPPERRLHRVVTPEGVGLPFEVASASDRIGAFAIDFALILAGTVATLLLTFALMAAGVPAIAYTLSFLLLFLLYNAYFIVSELHWSGRTVGKRKVGLRVVSRDGGPLSAEAILARNLTRGVELFLPLVALLAPRSVLPDGPGWAVLAGIVWLLVFAFLPLFGKDRLRCGDLVAGTMVVKEPAPLLLPDLSERAAHPSRPPAAGEPKAAVDPGDSAESIPFTREQLDVYGVLELQVLEDLLRRRDGGTLRPEVLSEVRAKIQAKIRWQSEGPPVPDLDFLNAFYRAQRARLEQKMLFGQRQERKKGS